MPLTQFLLPNLDLLVHISFCCLSSYTKSLEIAMCQNCRQSTLTIPQVWESSLINLFPLIQTTGFHSLAYEDKAIQVFQICTFNIMFSRVCLLKNTYSMNSVSSYNGHINVIGDQKKLPEMKSIILLLVLFK